MARLTTLEDLEERARGATRRWQADDAARGYAPGPWHVRHDGPDGKRVHWEAEDGTLGLGDHRLEDLAYGLREALEMAAWSDAPTVITEGEKAAAAVLAAGLIAVGTVCGASSTPGSAVIECFRGLRVALPAGADAADVPPERIGELVAAAEERGPVGPIRAVAA